MNFEVLVVDDNRQAAEEFARLITVKAGIQAVATDVPDEAIQLVKTHSIKVAILDQRMPIKDGTKLFRELRAIDPLVRGIMLTGEADAQEVGEALKLGFSDYIHKSNVESITPRVLLHYCAYHTDIAEKSDPHGEPLYIYRRGMPVVGDTIEFRLLSIESVEAAYVFSNSWRTLVRVDAGEKKTQTISSQYVARFVLEAEEKEKLVGSIGVRVPLIDGLTAKLEKAVERRFKTGVSVDETRTETVLREFKLADEPTDPSKTYVKSRQYEHAPVYRRMRIFLRKACRCCHSDEVVTAIAFQLTPRTATRQIDYLSDGTSQVLETGITQ